LRAALSVASGGAYVVISSGLRCDQTIALIGQNSASAYPQRLRRVKLYDAKHDKRLVFLTNNSDLPSYLSPTLFDKQPLDQRLAQLEDQTEIPKSNQLTYSRKFPDSSGERGIIALYLQSVPLAMQPKMTTQDLRTLLDRIRGIRHACDLDLLLFFYRHPRALLTGELLVTHLGYDPEQVGKSLDGLMEAGLVTRSQNPSYTARLYVLELDALPEGLLLSFLKIVATRAGRQEAMRLLRPGNDRTPRAGPRRSLRMVVA
jgi:hypothetical protein